MWFNFMEHSQIDEAYINKTDIFLHTLQCCEEGVIDVFKEICRHNMIEYAAQGIYIYIYEERRVIFDLNDIFFDFQIFN